MIFTEEEYMELAQAMSAAGPSRSNTVGAKNHVEDHNAIAKMIWGPSGDSKTTVMKITKKADSFNFSGAGGGEDLPLDSEYLEETIDTYMSYVEFYDVIVSQEGLLDLHYTEWPVGAWCELIIGGLMASMLKVDSFIRDSYGSQDDDMIKGLHLGAIWKLLTFSCDIQKHTYTSGAWSPAFPEMTDDTSMFDHNGNFFRPVSGNSYREGEVLYSVRPKHLDTIKDLTAAKETLEGKVSTLESDSATLNTTVSQLGEDVTALSNANSTLEGQVSTLESNNVSLNETVSGLETDLGSLSSANDTLSSTVSTLEGNVTTLTSDKEALEGQVSTLESTIANLTARLEALENPTTPE